MSLFKVTLSTGVRLDLVATQVVGVQDNGEGQPTTIYLSTGEKVSVNESGRSVRGYVKKALVPAAVTAKDEAE